MSLQVYSSNTSSREFIRTVFGAEVAESKFVAAVDGGACPPSLEWSLAPDRGAEGCLTRSVVVRMAFGRLRRPRVQELKSSPALQS